MRILRQIAVNWCVLATVLSGAAQTTQPAAVTAGNVTLDKSTGALRARLARSPTDRLETLTIAPIALDGETQRNWEIESDAADGHERRWGNARVSLSVAPISPRATAFEWTARDAAMHDFIIPIEDNSTYYGGSC